MKQILFFLILVLTASPALSVTNGYTQNDRNCTSGIQSQVMSGLQIQQERDLQEIKDSVTYYSLECLAQIPRRVLAQALSLLRSLFNLPNLGAIIDQLMRQGCEATLRYLRG